MKKIFLIISVFLLVFSSCETDFDVHAPWEEIAVVYGLLDQSQDRQYIKVNRAYLGEYDAFHLANLAESINFLPENMVVKLHKLQDQDTVGFIILDTTIIIKDPLDANGDLGIFSTENNIIYTTLEQDSDFVEVGKTYALTIKNTESGNLVSASTELIDFPTLPFFTFNPDNPLGFFLSTNADDSLNFKSENITWKSIENAALYQIDVRFNYKENDIEKFLTWTQPLTGGQSTRIEGFKFFNYLSAHLSEDEDKKREFLSLDVIMTIGTSDLATYIAMNEPYEGLVQERPSFSNIDNGLGLFSARYIYKKSGFSLSDCTIWFLVNELDRNFRYPVNFLPDCD